MTNTLSSILNRAIEKNMNEIHTSMPGQVQAYDFSTQKASVKPLIKKKYKDGKEDSLPVIVNVPVIFPRAKDFSMTFPIQPGDYVLLVFTERSMEKFLALGGEQDPGDFRKFDLTDAVAIPGLYPFSVPSIADNNEDFLLKFHDNFVRFKKNGDSDIFISGSSNLEITNSATIKVGTDITATVGGNANIDISGSCAIKTGGDLNATVGGSTNLNSSGNVNITAPTVNITGNLFVSGTATLAGGGPGIARQGDPVEVTVNISGGSSAGSYTGTGTITGGSGNANSG